VGGLLAVSVTNALAMWWLGVPPAASLFASVVIGGLYALLYPLHRLFGR
jgi:hypothetical protein